MKIKKKDRFHNHWYCRQCGKMEDLDIDSECLECRGRPGKFKEPDFETTAYDAMIKAMKDDVISRREKINKIIREGVK